ncbi:hypothetical protein HanPI659440_Chr13g0499351 [Helianthus annuus]|nr:hypothetical protein HanPI659440_Chr13g0499351 [Helianthus annuus]
MANKSNLSGCFNILNRNGLEWYVNQYAIPASLNPILPAKDTTIYPFAPRKIGVYTRMFDYCNYRLSLTKFLVKVLMFHEVHLSQMNPFGLAKVCQFELACRSLDSDPDLDVFQALYKLNRSGDWYTFEVRKKNACCYSWITTSLKDWKDRFFLVDDRCVSATMAWSYGLKEALRLKSFDSTELDIRATRTPKGDPPYLNVVKENLIRLENLLLRLAREGKKTGSSGAKDTGSKVVLYGSEHLSIEDEGVNTKGGEDDAEVRPQVSFKRGRSTSSKSDPNPKKVKKTKLDLKTVVLEDEVDQVTGFSAAGGFLENLDAHLHGGKTPKDRSVDLPPSPLSFGGPTTKVIDGTNMPDPLAFKKIDFSPSGKPTIGVASNVSRPSPQQIDGGDSSGDAVDVDSAQALERYVPDWSLANKDRIVDALSAKMSLFHIGTPAEHAYYRKISGLELGNALMLNQAQSNSLVVEAYKRWVEAESNCCRYEREADRLREQVSEAKEVSKASQASATAAYEVRDKAVHDLESLKLKFGALEENLSEVEERNKTEQKEMKSSYDQLLVDHLRLVNGMFITFSTLFFLASDPLLFSLDKTKIGRARDKAIESHQAVVADMKDMLTRYDGEMVELYSLTSELLLTKQWFLTEGVAWIVKLVHQSPELEKGFQAARSSAKSVEEILGYDEGAKGTLVAAINAFDDFHISVLDKVSELVNEPLSFIKEKSKLPIVKED